MEPRVGPREMRASKARSEHSVGIACHRRWAALRQAVYSGLPSNTRGGSRMRESRTYRLCAGGPHSNMRPYRDPHYRPGRLVAVDKGVTAPM